MTHAEKEKDEESVGIVDDTSGNGTERNWPAAIWTNLFYRFGEGGNKPEITEESQVGLVASVGSVSLSPKYTGLAEPIEVFNDPLESG